MEKTIYKIRFNIDGRTSICPLYYDSREKAERDCERAGLAPNEYEIFEKTVVTDDFDD